MNLGFSGEILFILLLALVLFGPRKLPELARQAGRLMAEFRKMSDHVQNQIQAEVSKLELEEADPTKSLAPALAETKSVLNGISIDGALNRLTESIASFSSKTSVPELKDPGKHHS